MDFSILATRKMIRSVPVILYWDVCWVSVSASTLLDPPEVDLFVFLAGWRSLVEEEASLSELTISMVSSSMMTVGQRSESSES